MKQATDDFTKQAQAKYDELQKKEGNQPDAGLFLVMDEKQDEGT